MPQPKLTMYFDLHSPYSYLAYRYIRDSPVLNKLNVDFVPVQLIAFVKAGAGTPPWGNKNKEQYLLRDLERWAHETAIPWRPGWPANYPSTRTSEVQKVVTACLAEYPNDYLKLLDALYHTFWLQKKGVQLSEVYEPILRDVLGQDKAERLMAMRLSNVVQEQLRKNTAAALADGACGLPWFHAVNAQGQVERYWGFDHLGQVARFVQIENLPTSHL